MRGHARGLCAHDAHAFRTRQRSARRRPGGKECDLVSCEGPCGLFLQRQGGYNLEAISVSATAVAKVVLGEAPPELPPMVASELATETVWQVAVQQSKYWKSVTPKACEPREGLWSCDCCRRGGADWIFPELEEITWSIPGKFYNLLKDHTD